MKKVLCILILLFNAFLCFSYEIDYVESFQLSKINFSQEINILSENLLIHEFETEVNLEIEPVQNINEKIECIIFCEPKGNGRSYTDTMVPIDFEVFLNKNRTDIWVINDGKKYSYREALNQNGYSNNISEIHFSINIEGKTELILKYVNMSIIGRMEIGFDNEKVNYRFASNNSYKEIKYIEKPNSNDTLFLTNIVPFKENEYRYDYYGDFYGKHYDGFYSECDGITGFDIKREI